MSWIEYLDEVKNMDFHQSYGKVTKVSSLSIEAIGLYGNVGDICSIKNSKVITRKMADKNIIPTVTI